jgi:hypothetical protein
MSLHRHAGACLPSRNDVTGGKMTEAEWLACIDHQPMLKFLHGRTSDRKLRLFSVACCFRYSRLLKDERCFKAVQVGERFADGLIAGEELFEAEEVIWRADQSGELESDGLGPACAYCCYRADDGSYPSGIAGEVANQILIANDEIQSAERYEAECKSLSNYVRCVFGNPFRSVGVHPAWLAWNDGTVQKIAKSIYEDRAFDRMPILADALEDAGCNNTDILNHCRNPGEHVRGCWVIDALLGKE